MHHATLVYVFENEKILLGMKKRGFGAGILNGYGGKVEEKETYEECAVREVYQEAKIKISNLEKVAELEFKFTNAPKGKDWDQTVHVFFTKNYRGTPQETEEMKPKWCDKNNIPFNQFWDADKYWLKEVLNGKKVYSGFIFRKDNSTVDLIYMEETAEFRHYRPSGINSIFI